MTPTTVSLSPSSVIERPSATCSPPSLRASCKTRRLAAAVGDGTFSSD
jgi:hypothetical protein